MGGYAVDLLPASRTQFAKRKGFSLPLIFFGHFKEILRPSAPLGPCREQNAVLFGPTIPGSKVFLDSYEGRQGVSKNNI